MYVCIYKSLQVCCHQRVTVKIQISNKTCNLVNKSNSCSHNSANKNNNCAENKNCVPTKKRNRIKKCR